MLGGTGSLGTDSMDLAIRFRSAVALLGGFPVLAGVDLDVAEGEVVLLQGANGAGKTSLLRACAGLLPIVSGTAEVLGHDLVTDRRGVRRDIGLLGHATALYDDLSVEDNVRFAVRAAGASRSLGRPGPRPARPVGPALPRGREPAVGRSAPAYRPGRPGGPRPAAVAARRAPRRARRRASRPARRTGAGRHGRGVPPCCWPPTSTTGPSPWPGGSSSWPAGRSRRRRRHRRTCRLRSWATASRPPVVGPGRRPRRRARLRHRHPSHPPRRRPLRRGPVVAWSRSMWRDAALVAGKDLRIEMRTRVATNQVAPFAVLVLVLFGFALDPDSGLLTKAAPGLFWIAVLFCSLLAVQRSFAVEAADSAQDGLRLSGLDPAGIFLGKAVRSRSSSSAWRSCSASASSSCSAPTCRAPPCCSPPRSRRPSAWPPPAPCTASWPPGCGSARRSCRC